MYIVGSNMPGYMPDEEPSTHETLEEAWACLLEDCNRYFDESCDSPSFKSKEHYEDCEQTLKELNEATPQECNVHLLDYVFWLTAE